MNLHRIYQIRSKLRKLLGLHKGGDDFDWDSYTYHYRHELTEVESEYTTILKPGDYLWKENKLHKKRDDITPLHPLVQVLYESVLALNPNSILECGCGGGDHVHNLTLLAPQSKVNGIDRSENQLDFLRKRHPSLDGFVFLGNLTDDPLVLPPQIQPDVAYTQAVVMHIKKEQSHLIALRNIFSLARKAVVLRENWHSHAFMDDIIKIHHAGNIPWKELHFHYNTATSNPNATAMIISPAPLAFPKLEDYELLRQAMSRI